VWSKKLIQAGTDCFWQFHILSKILRLASVQKYFHSKTKKAINNILMAKPFKPQPVRKSFLKITGYHSYFSKLQKDLSAAPASFH
jgi:hypothetical protein